MATYTIRSHNRTETAATLGDAKAIAKKRAQAFARAHGGRAVWSGPSSWSTDDDVRSHGGYAIVDSNGNDVAEGAAVIDTKAERNPTMARAKKNPKAKANPKAPQIGPDSIMIDGEIYDVDDVRDGGYLPSIEAGSEEFYVAKDSTAAGKAARKYWSDMAKHDKREFREMVGDEALLAWALGEPGGPGNAKVTSLEAWLDVTADHPEEQFAGYDGNERTVEAVGTNVKKELGFTPKVAYRHN